MRAIAFIVLLLCQSLHAVQPMPDGIALQWDRQTNEISYSVWRVPMGSTNWTWIANIGTNYFKYTNAVIFPTMFGVTVISRDTNGAFIEGEVGIAHWPPSTTNSTARVVRISPVGGWLVPTGVFVTVSRDLKTWTQRERYRISGTNVIVEHYESVFEPNIFFGLPQNPMPPFPGLKVP